MISNSNELIIIGAGGHAKSVASIAKSLNFNVIGYLDDFSNASYVIGKLSNINLYKHLPFAFGIGGINNLIYRFEILQNLKKFWHLFINLISPYALCSENLKIGIGNTIHPFVFINSDVQIGNFCIINTRATIEHDCIIGDNVHISTSAVLNGNVKIGNHVFIGSGSLIKNNVQIADNIIIGMGSVVLNDLLEPGTYVGNPLKKIR